MLRNFMFNTSQFYFLNYLTMISVVLFSGLYVGYIIKVNINNYWRLLQLLLFWIFHGHRHMAIHRQTSKAEKEKKKKKNCNKLNTHFVQVDTFECKFEFKDMFWKWYLLLSLHLYLLTTKILKTSIQNSCGFNTMCNSLT